MQTLISSQISFLIRRALSSFAFSAKLGQDLVWTKCFFILKGNETLQLGFTKSLRTNCQVVIWMRTWATVLKVVKKVLVKILVSHEIEWVLVHQKGWFDSTFIFECQLLFIVLQNSNVLIESCWIIWCIKFIDIGMQILSRVICLRSCWSSWFFNLLLQEFTFWSILG